MPPPGAFARANRGWGTGRGPAGGADAVGGRGTGLAGTVPLGRGLSGGRLGDSDGDAAGVVD